MPVSVLVAIESANVFPVLSSRHSHVLFDIGQCRKKFFPWHSRPVCKNMLIKMCANAMRHIIRVRHFYLNWANQRFAKIHNIFLAVLHHQDGCKNLIKIMSKIVRFNRLFIDWKSYVCTYVKCVFFWRFRIFLRIRKRFLKSSRKN